MLANYYLNRDGNHVCHDCGVVIRLRGPDHPVKEMYECGCPDGPYQEFEDELVQDPDYYS